MSQVQLFKACQEVLIQGEKFLSSNNTKKQELPHLLCGYGKTEDVARADLNRLERQVLLGSKYSCRFFADVLFSRDIFLCKQVVKDGDVWVKKLK